MAKKKKVLLVEDHLGERIKMMQTLQEFDVEVETAVTFSRAKELASKRKYDVIISELLLSHCPELQGDGIQFWKSMEDHRTPTVFLVADDGLRKTTESLMEGESYPPIFAKPLYCDAIRIELNRLFKLGKKLAA